MKYFAAAGAVLAASMLVGTAMAAGHQAPEWVGIFPIATPTASATWSMQKVSGKYADQTMKLVIIPSTTPTKAGMEALEATGKTLMNGACPDAASGTNLAPVAAGSCFNLKVNDAADDSSWTITMTGLTGVFFAAQHVPTEFERTKHYFYDHNQSPAFDIEPTAQEPEPGAGGHSHGHGAAAIKCECEARENGWSIDCSKMAPVTTSVDYLTASCGTNATDATQIANRKTKACIQAYYNFQAHHDFCPHDTLPSAIENGFHSHEALYTDCTIKRQFDATISNCPALNCSDMSMLTTQTNYLNANCGTCTSAECKVAFQTVLMSHDTCAESQLPGTLETALHAFEEKCKTQICNTATAPFDLKAESCPGVTPAAVGSGAAQTSVVAASLMAAFAALM